MSRALLLVALAPVLLAAAGSAPVLPVRETVEQALARTRVEAGDAARRTATLETAAASAGDEVAKLRAEQRAAAAQIEAAEATIAAADAAYVAARAEVALREARLARRRAPEAALLAGIATMGRQPPLLAIADGTSIEELVRVRALLDTTMPLIARRSATLAAELKDGQRLAAAAAAARGEIAAGQTLLARRQARFAALERQAAARNASLEGQAFGQQERVIASGEDVADLGSAAAAAAAARANARRLALLDFAPARPFAAEQPPAAPAAPAYSLPSNATVIEGLGAVGPFGVSARGLRLATVRGTRIIAPANGRILFAGAYREQDGVVIIDHGGGWTSLLLGVATRLPKGSEVRRGEPLGTALGDVTVELRYAGRPVSAALIAGSSATLSNSPQTR